MANWNWMLENALKRRKNLDFGRQISDYGPLLNRNSMRISRSLTRADIMADQEKDIPTEERNQDGGTKTLPKPGKPKSKQLPPWKVLLHNDDVNDMVYVVETIQMLTPLARREAMQLMLEAHFKDVALILTTHQERAELFQQQFGSRNLTVTIEPA